MAKHDHTRHLPHDQPAHLVPPSESIALVQPAKPIPVSAGMTVEKPLIGTVAGLDGSMLMLDQKAVKTTHQVAKDAMITVNGVKTVLSDLKFGDKITATGDPLAQIDAVR